MDRAQQATEFKNLGNQAFIEHKYEKAIEFYSQALQKDEKNSILYSNRGRAYKMVGNYVQAYDDCAQAILYDESNIKAHLLSGQSLALQGKNAKNGIELIKKAIKEMVKALTLCAGQNKQSFQKDLDKYIKRAKKLLYFKEFEVRKNTLEREKQELLVAIDEKSKHAERAKANVSQWSLKLEPKLSNDIPEHLCCPITLGLFEDPVMTEHGLSYEKSALITYLQGDKFTDPIAGKPLNKHIPFVPNLVLKQIVEHYISEQPWAYEHFLEQNTIDSIEF